MAHILLARVVLRRQPFIVNTALSTRFRSNRSQRDPPPPEPAGGSSTPEAAPPAPPPPGGPLTLDFTPRAEPDERTGARSSKGSLSSIERRRRFMGRLAFGIFAMGIGFGVVHLGRPWEPDELSGRQSVDENAGRWARTSYRFKNLAGTFRDPQWEQLLPPQLSKEEQRPYTLLLSIDDLLVTSTWDRQHGWRTAKRPGVDYFLGYLQQWFEIVIFTTQPHYTADPIIEKLDPLHALITYRLFREATRFHDGKLVKDLSYLNRDLARVVAVDTDAERYSLNRENAVILPKWTGDPQDKGLVGVIPFLESIGIYNPADVRPIIGAYVDKDVVSEYGKAEAEAKQRLVEEWERKGGRRKSAPSWLGQLFGTPGSIQSDKPPASYLEKKRQEAQRNYRLDQEYLKRNEGSIKQWLQEQQDASLKALGSSSLFGALTGLGKPPGEAVREGGKEGAGGAGGERGREGELITKSSSSKT
ncbi:HAD-like domain-containing protein [Gautieria morchelliformis]|nr:HAD-like domain-containing protein [Gautieria morchelliformis]